MSITWKRALVLFEEVWTLRSFIYSKDHWYARLRRADSPDRRRHAPTVGGSASAGAVSGLMSRSLGSTLRLRLARAPRRLVQTIEDLPTIH